jgi:hypothetical protein
LRFLTFTVFARAVPKKTKNEAKIYIGFRDNSEFRNGFFSV